MIPAEKKQMDFDFESFENDDVIATVLAFRLLKKIQKKKQSHSQFNLLACFQHEIEYALSGVGFWHQKSMTD